MGKTLGSAMTGIVDNQGTSVYLVAKGPGYIRVTGTGGKFLLWIGIQVYFIDVVGRVAVRYIAGQFIGLPHMNVSVFIVADKTELVSPGSLSLRVAVCDNFVNQGSSFLHIGCRQATDSHIQESVIHSLIGVEKTEVIV